MQPKILRKCVECSLEAYTESCLELFVKAKTSKHGRQNLCKKCNNNRANVYYHSDKERYKKNNKKWSDANKETVAKSKNRYYLENRERILKKRAKYQVDNGESISAYKKEYAKLNRGKIAAWHKLGKERRNKRVPAWLTEDDKWMISLAYEVAKERTEKYGVKFEVDHIIPLRGKFVSGLHVPSNIQVITQYENRLKSNSFNPEDFTL